MMIKNGDGFEHEEDNGYDYDNLVRDDHYDAGAKFGRNNFYVEIKKINN